MALYYFHLCGEGDVLLDPEGQEVREEGTIGGLALKEARAIITADALCGRINLMMSIEVRAESGRLVHELPFREAVTISGG
jgi:hypothetical protein